MNRKQFVILIVLVLVLGGAGLWILKNQDKTWNTTGSSAGQKLLPNFPVNDVQEIAIKQGTNTLTLVKKDEIWKVAERGDYPANFGELSEFLRKLIDLKIVQSEKIGQSQFVRMELNPPGQGTNSGTLIELKGQGGKPLNSLILGKKHLKKSDRPSPFGEEGGFPAGRYVLVGKEQQNVLLISDPLSNVEPKAESWLDKEFFKVEKVRSISLTSTNATNSWTISRESETNDWNLSDSKPGEQLENGKASAAANALASPSFVDVVPANASAEQTGMDKPTTVKIETFDYFTYTVRVGKGSGEENHHFAMAVAASPAKERTAGKDEKPEDKEKLDKEFKEKNQKLEEKLKQEKKFEKWTYLVSKWTVDALLKDRSQMMVEKKEEKKEDGPGASGLPPGLNLPPGFQLPTTPAKPETPPPAPPAEPKKEAPKD